MEDGSYLDNGNCMDCKSKFEHCTKCDKNECKTCETNYKLDNGKCVPDCTKFFNENCTSCDELSCKTCKPNYDLVGNDCIANCPTKFGKNCLTCTTSLVGNDCIANCPTKFGKNCLTCTTSACTSCKTGYAINNDTCISCTEKFGTGCSECTTTGCSACKNGYILSNGTCSSCSDKFSSNCTACNSTACTACASGYVLGSSPTSASACISSECAEALARNTFCTGDNYMGICTKDNKAICVTRKNMGDSTTLTIPSRVNVVSVNQNTCLASSTNFCCWKGNTSGTNCNNLYGNYSGCYRTVCDKYAAAYICNSFRGGGKTWRLPTLNEMSNWIDYSNYAVNNPLQLCSTTPSHSLTYCGQEKFCLGSAHYYTGSDGERLNHGCTPPGVWSSEKIEGTVVDYGYYSMLEYPWIQYGGNATNGMSVRCVTDLY